LHKLSEKSVLEVLGMSDKDEYEPLLRQDVVYELNSNQRLKKTRHLCLMYLTTMPLLRVNGTFIKEKWTFRRKQLEGIARQVGYEFEYTRVALEMLEKLEAAGLVGRICDEKTDFYTQWYITDKGINELKQGMSNLVLLLDRVAQVRKEAPRLRGKGDFEEIISLIEGDTEKMIG
jgi:DNA-binding MarR family transcriptional regulator